MSIICLEVYVWQGKQTSVRVKGFELSCSGSRTHSFISQKLFFCWVVDLTVSEGDAEAKLYFSSPSQHSFSRFDLWVSYRFLSLLLALFWVLPLWLSKLGRVAPAKQRNSAERQTLKTTWSGSFPSMVWNGIDQTGVNIQFTEYCGKSSENEVALDSFSLLVSYQLNHYTPDKTEVPTREGLICFKTLHNSNKMPRCYL